MPEEIIGYRAWRLCSYFTDRPLGESEDLRSPVLPAGMTQQIAMFSLTSDFVWPGPVVTSYNPPSPRNYFGLYALREHGEAKEYSISAPVTGEVSLYGHVVEHAYGWRASHMLLRRIWLHPLRLPLSTWGDIPRQLSFITRILEMRYQCDVMLDGGADKASTDRLVRIIESGTGTQSAIIDFLEKLRKGDVP